MAVLAAGFYSLVASGGTGGGGGTTQPQMWWTGFNHATVWAGFAVTNTSAPPPRTGCTSNTPPRPDPPIWWGTQNPNTTGGADAVGTTLWSSTDLTCPRAMEFVWRSVMVADLSDFYTKFPSGTADMGNRISKATLDFNVIPMMPVNPLSFPCDPFMGSAGLVNVLPRNAVIVQGSTQTLPVDTQLRGLIQASPAGAVTGPNTLTAFPTQGDMVANLGLIAAQGTFANGTVVVMDTGPGIHNVKVDVKNWVRGAANLSLGTIAFSVAGINEAPIAVNTPVQFDCRSWVQPIQLSVEFL
jgi:hypothetical protein